MIFGLMYVNRYIEDTILETDAHFKVLYLSGPRQVGKTTVLQRLAEKQNRRFVTLDDLRLRELAQKDPLLFLQSYPAPVLIDEVQYAPDRSEEHTSELQSQFHLL